MPVVSTPSAKFNGGTITNGLTITPPAASEALVITGVDGDTTKLINATAVHTTFTLDSDGQLTYSSDDHPFLDIRGVSSSADLSVICDTAQTASFRLVKTGSSNGVSMTTGAGISAQGLPIVAVTSGGASFHTLGPTTLGFYGATPAAQPTAVADAAGGVVIDAEARAALNALLARVRTLGLIAT